MDNRLKVVSIAGHLRNPGGSFPHKDFNISWIYLEIGRFIETKTILADLVKEIPQKSAEDSLLLLILIAYLIFPKV
jgi:hypothetical protein